MSGLQDNDCRKFQSTLPRGERHASSGQRRSAPLYFNPRSREGSDRVSALLLRSSGYFNPRSREGSDPELLLPYRFFGHFNPRSREGSDGFRQINLCRGNGFQSTLPRGERLLACHLRCCLLNFNPRSREGSDASCVGNVLIGIISIHAPARGATCCSL